jgi:RNA polymerase sigma-70 factor (ECF subfamily)
MSDLTVELEPHIPALRRYAWALLRHREAADDLVQDCLERAISRWHLHRKGTSTRAWLLSIQRNLFLNDRRRRGRQGTLTELTDNDMALLQDPYAERSLMARDALSLIDAMPEDQKSLLLLIAVEDLSYHEAALVFGVPEGTIMSRLSRARAALRQMVEGGERVTLRRVK